MRASIFARFLVSDVSVESSHSTQNAYIIFLLGDTVSVAISVGFDAGEFIPMEGVSGIYSGYGLMLWYMLGSERTIIYRRLPIVIESSQNIQFAIFHSPPHDAPKNPIEFMYC